MLLFQFVYLMLVSIHICSLSQAIKDFDTIMKKGVTQNVTTKFQAIIGMSCYCEKSFDVSQFDSSGWHVLHAQAKWLLVRQAA